MQIKSIMTHEVVTLTGQNSLKEAILLMRDKKIGSIIIKDEDNLVTGIITEGDILNLINDDFTINADLKIADLPKKEHIFTILESETVDNAIDTFYKIPIHHLVVTDYSGILTGIISTKDIIKAEEKLAKAFPYFPNSQLTH